MVFDRGRLPRYNEERSGWTVRNTQGLRRIRLEAQDTALSRLRHGFESRMRYKFAGCKAGSAIGRCVLSSWTRVVSTDSLHKEASIERSAPLCGISVLALDCRSCSAGPTRFRKKRVIMNQRGRNATGSLEITFDWRGGDQLYHEFSTVQDVGAYS